MLRRLTNKDKTNFSFFANEHKIEKTLFKDFIKQNKVAFISEEHDIINGLLFVSKEDKNYLNVVSSSKKIINNLLKIFFWNWKKEIFAKIDEKNKVGFILKTNGFKIINKIDTTFLLCYNPKQRRYEPNKRK
jgi:hypothetical protein